MSRSVLPLIIFVLAAPLAASAQTASPATPPPPAAGAAPAGSVPNGAPQHRHPRYLLAVRSLTLTADQKQQIAGFLHDTKAANQGADRGTRRANAKKLRDEINGVLTPDQRTQLRAALAQQRAAAQQAPQSLPQPQSPPQSQ